MKPILIVYDIRAISRKAIVVFANELRTHLDMTAYILESNGIGIPDIRLWDLTTLQPIELEEVKQLLASMK